MARLPVYLRILYDLAADRVANVSSERLAELAGVNAAKVRKDLSYLGSYGTRGVGYEVDYLTYQMSRELGLTHDWPVVIVGRRQPRSGPRQLRRLRRAGLPGRGRRRHRPGQGGHDHRPGARSATSTTFPSWSGAGHAIGVIATPAGAAQDAADRLVGAGVTAILNFAPQILTVPRGVQRPQGRSGRRAADPQLLPAASIAGSDQRRSSTIRRLATRPAREDQESGNRCLVLDRTVWCAPGRPP